MPPRPKPSANAAAAPPSKAKAKEATGAVLGFEQTLWEAADKLRGSMDPSEYKHVVLGLLFLKYISDAFEEKHEALTAEGEDAEDRDQYSAENIFWVPEEVLRLPRRVAQGDVGDLVEQLAEAPLVELRPRILLGLRPRDGNLAK